jgi:hypothetical protein
VGRKQTIVRYPAHTRLEFRNATLYPPAGGVSIRLAEHGPRQTLGKAKLNIHSDWRIAARWTAHGDPDCLPSGITDHQEHRAPSAGVSRLPQPSHALNTWDRQCSRDSNFDRVRTLPTEDRVQRETLVGLGHRPPK